MTLDLLVVIGSTRPGRVGGAVARWFVDAARRDSGIRVAVADLAELELPLMNEPAHPRLGQYVHEHTKSWSATVAAADAIVFVMPEYNHSFSAPVKNAIDYLSAEWRDKSVGFVAYGGISGGTRAIQALRPVILAMKAVPVLESVIIPGVSSRIVDGVFQSAADVEASAAAMLAEIQRREPALRALRD